jgi:hypothetical protein
MPCSNSFLLQDIVKSVKHNVCGAGAAVDAVDYDKRTPLLVALEDGHRESLVRPVMLRKGVPELLPRLILRILTVSSATSTSLVRYLATCRHLGAQCVSHPKCSVSERFGGNTQVQLLLDANANPNAVSPDWVSALHFLATRSGCMRHWYCISATAWFVF